MIAQGEIGLAKPQIELGYQIDPGRRWYRLENWIQVQQGISREIHLRHQARGEGGA